LPLREAKKVAVFDSSRKYILDLMNETAKGKFIDETIMRQPNNLGSPT